MMKAKTMSCRYIYHDIEILRLKTMTTRSQDQKTATSRFGDQNTTVLIKPQHRDSKAFFQRAKSHDIGITRLKKP